MAAEKKGNGMLVLSRQRDETLMIGDDIEVVVVDIRGDKVRLGIRAPSEVPVHRKEVYDAIKREARASQNMVPPVPAKAGEQGKHESDPVQSSRESSL